MLLLVCLQLNALIVSAQSSRKTPKATDYDYKALAIQSVREVVQETKKLSNIEHKVDLLIAAASLLNDQKTEATDVLDQALADLKEWESDANAPLSRRFVAAELRNRVLAQYLLVDKEKALQFTSDTKPISSQSDPKQTKSDSTWKRTLLDRQVAADKSIVMAESLLETNPQQATFLLASSVREGAVSPKLAGAIQKLRANPELLKNVHTGIANELQSAVAFDSASIRTASILAMDQEMSAQSRAAFVQFLLRSLESWTTLISNSRSDSGFDAGYIDSMFMAFAFNARPLFLQYAADDAGRFDLLIDQLSLQASPKTRDLLKSTAIVEPSDPKDRLTDILREPQASRRDSRLLRFVVSLLRREDAEDYESLLAEAVRNVTDEPLKSSLGDFVSLGRVARLAKAEKLNDATRAAEAMSNSELKAWALLALSSSVAATDRYLAMTLVNGALKSLDRSTLTPRTVEVALLGAALTSGQDPDRSIEILGSAAKYANSVEDSPESNSNIASAVIFEISIGSIKILPARPPARLSDLHVNPAIGTLSKRDWFGLQKVASTIKDPLLRLSLKLELAKGVIQENRVSTPSPVSGF